MNDHITRFIEMFDKSGILKPVFLTAFFNEVIFSKPNNFAAVLSIAEKSFREVEENETGKAIRRLEIVK